MMLKFKNSKKGFTVIEVVLVLAVAGLIFLMVFFALPALQRSQRDMARKNDARNLVVALVNYRANNRGRVLFNTSNDAWDKLSPYWTPSEFISPGKRTGHIDDFSLIWSAQEQDVVSSRGGSSWRKPGDWAISIGVTCHKHEGSDGYVWRWGGNRLNRKNISVMMELEGVRTKQGWGYCVDENSLH